MKTLTYIVSVMVLFFSCSQEEKQPPPISSVPLTVEIKGRIVPKDSMELPIIIPAGQPAKVDAVNPTVFYPQSNVYPAGSPSVVPVGSPKVSTPGRNGLPLPQIDTATFSDGRPATPEISTAKEAYQKDHNPHNFSTFSKLQGLKSNLILSMLEDNQGNIWFGTNYGGVSKYDGKSFYHYSKEDGLSENSVWSIIQDENNSIWFATMGGGITKYDGNVFSHLMNTEGLGYGAVWRLLKDKKGNLWFGTVGRGAAKFDGETITNYTGKVGLSDTITSILEDRLGNLWFGTYSEGVSRFDGKSFTRFTETEGLIDNTVGSMLEDKNGNIWFATENGICKYDGSNFTHYTEKEGLSENWVKMIAEDKNGVLWLCTVGGGISSFDGKKFTHFTEEEGLSINYVSTVLEDKNGNLWFGTDGGGVSKYTSSFIQFTDKNGLINKFVGSIHEDRNGNLWIGTFSGGVSKFDGQKFVHFTEADGLSNIYTLSILEDKKGNLWFGTREGVSKFDGRSFFNFTQKEGLSHNAVWSMLEDAKGNLWFGTGGGGVNKFDGENFTLFTEEQGLSHNNVVSMLEDRNGNLWFGTYDGSLNKFDGANFTHFTEKEGLGNNAIREIAEDQDGNIWVGTQGDGLFKLAFTPNSETVSLTRFSEEQGLSDNKVTALFKSKKEDLWIGTSFGLNLLRKEEISRLNRGVNTSEYSPLNHQALFKTYTYEDGFSGIGLNHGKTIFEASNGTVWLGADDKLIAFDPQAQILVKTPPNIQLTGLALFNENIEWQTLADPAVLPLNHSADTSSVTIQNDLEQKLSAKNIGLMLENGVRVHDFRFDGFSEWYGVPENLSLRYDNNHITFQYVGIDTQAPNKIKYQYQLEGIDPHWSGLTDQGQASYGNLPHGQYTFKVRAMNGEGLWSDELHYPFEIRPPWWLTWWAQALYAMMGLGLLYGLRKYTVNRERIKHALKIQKLETEKMQEVDHLKSRFFANISHEFRTPLTLILGPLENFVSRTPAEHPDKPVFQMMQRNAKRLLRLINQLLDLSKIETGSMKLEPKPAELVAFLKSLILSFAPLAERQQITYTFQYPGGHPVAYFDEDKLEKIITNLLSNAFKFTPSGGTIRVSAILREPEKESMLASGDKRATAPSTQITLEFKVRDSGAGIPADETSNIFDRFYQIDATQIREQDGTGIGLSLVKELVELHEGEIFVESEVGQGSCFTVWLPLLMAGTEEMTISSTNGESKIVTFDQVADEMFVTPRPLTEDTNPEAPLVLIIEDNADVRFFIRENLRPFYQIIEAADGEEGYKLAVETIPDLILSDVMMPKMDGVELSRKLRENQKTAHVPLILLTARASGGDKIEGLETGADDYLVKPFVAPELLARMKNLIEGRRKLREHFSREIILQPIGIPITSMDEKFLNHALKIIEEHMSDAVFGIEVFCSEIGMSRTQLFRKLKALTNYAPGDFIRLMRLKRAAELLSLGAGSIGEVAFMVGFQDPSYFTKSFQKQFGKTPSEFIAGNSPKTNHL